MSVHPRGPIPAGASPTPAGTFQAHRVEVDQLDRVAVGILDKGDMGRAVRRGAGLAGNPGALRGERVADPVDVPHPEGEVAEARSKLVPGRLAPIEGQSHDAVAVFGTVPPDGVGELTPRVVVLAQELHAEELGVDLDRGIEMLDPDRRVHHAETAIRAACPILHPSLRNRTRHGAALFGCRVV